MIRSYSQLKNLDTLEARYNYLVLKGNVGHSTFGFDRYINQQFYTSREWRQIRHEIISRDSGCDLGIAGYEIFDRAIIHHMNPMTVKHISEGEDFILDPEYLITTTHRTHNAIHYGDKRLLPQPLIARNKGDTKLW